MEFRTIEGYAGVSRKTPVDVFVATTRRGWSYYVPEGGIIINKTHMELSDGIDVESIVDFDCITADDYVRDMDDFEREINS